MTEINTLWLFSTPVAIFNLSDFVTDDVNHALQNIGYTTNSLVDGIRGDADPSKIPALKPLYNKFQECIDEYSNRIGIHTSYIYESWMNILSMNGSVGVHRHYDSVISGAYYPYVDEGSAPITFVSATEGFRMLDVQHTRKDAPGMYTSNIENVESKTGQLVLFPSWVQHYVPPNKTNMRITLSFNTQYNL
jgi:uncharacterized protein (TIGR02466 family)